MRRRDRRSTAGSTCRSMFTRVRASPRSITTASSHVVHVQRSLPSSARSAMHPAARCSQESGPPYHNGVVPRRACAAELAVVCTLGRVSHGRRISDGRGRHPTADVPRHFAADCGTTAAATTSTSVRRSIVMHSQTTTGGVRRNASENSQINPLDDRSCCPR